jgi:outer membrane protein TolC
MRLGCGWHLVFLVVVLAAATGLSLGQSLPASDEPVPPRDTPLPAPRQDPSPPFITCPDPNLVLLGPTLQPGAESTRLPLAQPRPRDQALPINLATALRLAGARPLVITAAQASVEVAAARLDRAGVLWLPSVDAGVGYYRHDGATQGQSGNFYINTKDQFMAGGGVTAVFSATDAIFAPLAARQVLRSRASALEVARNDALLAVAESYFNVQQARGQLAGASDVITKSQALADKINSLERSPLTITDLNRARAQFADVDQAAAAAREAWRLASADLTQVLRLNLGAMVVPLEPPDLRVTLISPRESVDALIPIGLTYRPELASQQALVQAALARIRQERMRPLIPSLILQGGPGAVGPGGFFMGGVFASGAHGSGDPTGARDDISAGLVWSLDNLGFGNRATVRERRAEQQQALVELFRAQDMVAADVARAHALLESATVRLADAERFIQAARSAFEGSFREIGHVIRVGELQVLVRRAFEVVDALRSLSRAYDTYFLSVNDYNRAQFRLYRALGYPAQILACERPPGGILPVDTTRPPQMAPVCAPDPCPCPR